MREGTPNFYKPSPNETKVIEDAKRDADPTSYSELPLKGEILDIGKASEGYEYRLVSNKGETYVKLDGRSSDPSQFFTAKILKGIVNVSDVVRDDKGNYYSKVMPLEKIQGSTPASEIYADIFVIKALMGDGDRDFIPEHNGVGQYAKNLQYDAGKVAYFDFGNTRGLDPQKNTATNALYTDVESLEIADKKLNSIYSRLNGTMGTLFVKSIMKETGADIEEVFPALKEAGETEEEKISALQAALIHKVHEARSEVQQRLAKEWDTGR